jgi:hypothetical protein
VDKRGRSRRRPSGRYRDHAAMRALSHDLMLPHLVFMSPTFVLFIDMLGIRYSLGTAAPIDTPMMEDEPLILPRSLDLAGAVPALSLARSLCQRVQVY